MADDPDDQAHDDQAHDDKAHDDPDPEDEERPLLSERVAQEAWEAARRTPGDRPATDRPLLVVFAGIPLSGKSTTARALTWDAEVATLHAENDALRARVAAILGRPPQQDRFEHFITYQAAWTLCRLALDAGTHAVHDATNLDERGREGAYDTADAAGADTFVVFVDADRALLDARAEQLSEDRQSAYHKYREKRPDPDACTRPHILLDGARPVTDNLARLRDEPALRRLWDP